MQCSQADRSRLAEPLACASEPRPVGAALAPGPCLRSSTAELRAGAIAPPSQPHAPADQLGILGIGAVGGSALNFTRLVLAREPKRQFKIVSDLNFRIQPLLHERGTRSERALDDVSRQSSTR